MIYDNLRCIHILGGGKISGVAGVAAICDPKFGIKVRVIGSQSRIEIRPQAVYYNIKSSHWLVGSLEPIESPSDQPKSKKGQ